ncbi:hypothetical protein BH18ACI4_BH18ACI4_18120 [soil metagenome]
MLGHRIGQLLCELTVVQTSLLNRLCNGTGDYIGELQKRLYFLWGGSVMFSVSVGHSQETIHEITRSVTNFFVVFRGILWIFSCKT